jgi:hypothetical protein
MGFWRRLNGGTTVVIRPADAGLLNVTLKKKRTRGLDLGFAGSELHTQLNPHDSVMIPESDVDWRQMQRTSVQSNCHETDYVLEPGA